MITDIQIAISKNLNSGRAASRILEKDDVSTLSTAGTAVRDETSGACGRILKECYNGAERFWTVLRRAMVPLSLMVGPTSPEFPLFSTAPLLTKLPLPAVELP